MEIMSNKTYYTVKTAGGEDGVGENWTHLKALLHIRRCEYDEQGIEYEIIEHETDTDTLQPAEPKRKRRKSSGESSSE